MSASIRNTKIVTTFAEGTFFDGEFKFSSAMKIKGKVRGSIDCDGFLYIDEGAEVNADISAKSMVIAGKVSGNITVSDALDLMPTARIKGDIKTSRLRIDDGVELIGNCEMLKPSAADIDIFSAPADKIKAALRS